VKHAAFIISALTAALHVTAHAAGDVRSGKTIFTSRCSSCHAVGPSARGAFGPQLNGIFGRTAGGTDDYKYTPEMKKSGIVWSEKTLAAFIAAPGKVVPGTRMRFGGIGDQRKIEDLLAYLHTYQ
jgi:cytochrome c